MGLIVGSGVLIGKTLIQEAQTKDTMAIATDLAIAVREFKNNYNYFPGDLPDVAVKISGIASESVCSYNRDDDSHAPDFIVGNGVINTEAVGDGKLSEVECLPQHLAEAGLIRGNYAVASDGHIAPMRSHFGAVRIVSRADFDADNGTSVYPVGMQGKIRNIIVFDHLPLDVARGIDRAMDDGNITTGRNRASAEQNPVPFYIMPL